MGTEKKETNQLRFLITRIDRIGDVVLSTPLPREIKRVYPDSFVAMLVREYTKDIYLNNPYVDEIIIYNDKEKSFEFFIKQIQLIRSFRFTHAFMLLPDERLNYILFFAGIPYRVGVGHKIFQMLTFTRFVDRKKYNPLRHEADYALDMIRKVGIEPKSLEPEIYLTDNEKEEAKKFRSEIANDKILVGINTTSGNSAPNLFPSEYRKLIERLSEESKLKLIITDKQPPDEILKLKEFEFPFINNSLREAIIKFSALDLLVSNSTGPMHICAALKVPTLSLFCPLTACSPKLWGPLGNKSKIILPKEIYCQTQCPGDPKLCRYEGDSGINADSISIMIKSFLEIDQ
ncbi:ADP-heptose:LPS heptosyltransferase [Ignavibacterium album JCM 16511]|uniref:ADP-heptose:LPS heptosyltransferase n=1 Tax=Ignavibacterium album (strain DSM 19864 / JCM 16511 / NBRC 101810 / Mat9-16) TaxID=945713 RepID=I0AJ18_IGNAJ|nr:glycosyltransferase family 9 protein [Ignavibacterium album]AFH48975.1 ADP-heptose:LPS heptosyltransferase [Ignavibacterium album JCM 16511]